jgi:hypothetical protein
MRRRSFHSLLCGAWLGGCWGARGEEDPPAPLIERPNLVLPTWGGKQFWQDEWFFDRWHIQRNVLSGHCRLLDGEQRRHAWGTLAECRARFEMIREQQQLPGMQGTGVVVLHGLMRSSGSMAALCDDLRRRVCPLVFNVTYPTTRGDVATHAQALARVVTSLGELQELHFVAHSLGNLVIRHWLADRARAGGAAAGPRLGRMVMLGPPNRGARLAEIFGRNAAFDWVVGRAGTQLASGWDQLEPQLATPEVPFGVIAGGRGDGRGYNPILQEDNDLIVTVRSTRLAGAADFALLPVLHTVMMDDALVREYTRRFLQKGYFISSDRRQPITAEA